jgi:hypothetical protein
MDLVKQPVFWAAHLRNVTRGPLASDDPGISDTAFGISTDAIEEFYLRDLSNEEEWPCFHIPLRSGSAVEVVYANEPEDYQVFYYACPQKAGPPICLGKGGGHWQLPAFRWTEIVDISQAAVESASAMLLPLPSTWLTNDDNMDDVRLRLTDALEKLSPL